MKNNRLFELITQFKKTSIFLALCLVILFSYKLFFASSGHPPQDTKVVEVEKVQRKDIQQTAHFIGTIKAEKETLLIAKTRGILDRQVSSGQAVKAGDLIAKIENTDIERNYQLAQDMEKIAKTQYERLSQLMASGVSSKHAAEEKESLWMEYQKKLSDAKIAYDDINITAPFDGIVGIFKLREGSQVREGDALVSFYDPSSTIVEFDVPISITRLVQDGAPVFINQKPYTLTHIQKMLDEATHMSPAYTNIQCEQCIIGAAVDVDLVVIQKKSVIVIPFEAVFLRDGKTQVYRVEEDKTVLTPVELGIREKELTEITAGLKEGDRIITYGQARLYPGMQVNVQANDQ